VHKHITRVAGISHYTRHSSPGPHKMPPRATVALLHSCAQPSDVLRIVSTIRNIKTARANFPCKIALHRAGNKMWFFNTGWLSLASDTFANSGSYLQLASTASCFMEFPSNIHFHPKNSMALRSVRFNERSRMLSNIGESLDG
jgi:hypothetical protein